MIPKIVTVVLALLLISGGTVISSFDDGTLDGFTGGDTDEFEASTEQAYEGSHSLKDNSTGFHALRNEFDAKGYTSVTWAVYYNETANTRAQRPQFELSRPSDGNPVFTVMVDDGSTVSGADANSILYYNGTDFVDTGANMVFQNWTVWGIENIDYGNSEADFVVYYENNTEIFRETDIPFRNPTTDIFDFEWRAHDDQVYIDQLTVNGSVGNGAVTETTLELDINRWMPRDDSQPYTVTLNETNTTTGESNITDVTADANVTIYNITNTTGFSEPIATVNNTSDTIKSYNQTGVVAVNATYDGATLTNATNLTVGPRNLSNIGIMPPPQWPCSFLGCDSAPGGGDNPHNIGSSMQMLWLIIFIMVAGTQMIENPWAGVGSGIVSGILFWVMEFIDLGTMLTIVFAGILMGLLMARTSMGRGVTRDNEYSGGAVKNEK